MLEIRDLQTGYGKKQVLFGLSLDVRAGEIVAIIGPNGSGKSTIMKAAYGLLPIWDGAIHFDGASIKGHTSAQNFARGITFSPQGNPVFNELSVLQNLQIGGLRFTPKERNKRIDEVFGVFPILKQRLAQEAGKLSGGEQQMLALARALMSKPKMLMLDEPSIGLSPSLIALVFEKIVQLNRDLGVTILVVEQRVREVLEICFKVYSIKLGKVAFAGPPSILRNNNEKLKELFL